MEVESQTTTTTVVQTQTTTTPGGVVYTDVHPMAGTSALAVLFVASLVEFVAAARFCDTIPKCEKQNAWAVAVGVVSAICTFAVLLYLRFTPTLSPLVIKILGFFLTALWIAGAGIVTFRGPFILTGNGYFSSWVAFGAAGYFLHENVTLVQSAVQSIMARTMAAGRETQALWVTLFASVIELTAASLLCQNFACEKQIAWAVVVGALSIFLCLLCLFLNAYLGVVKAYLALLLLGIWTFGAGVLTFDAPFLVTSNGYFSSWVAYFATVVWAYGVWGEKFPALKRPSLQG